MIRTTIISLLVSLSLCANAQLPLKTVVQKYNNFKSALPPTRIHLVLNQDKYAAGDTIFFKAYFFKEAYQLVTGRQLIEANLVAPGGKIARHFLFAVSNGIGANQLILPDTLAAGIYMLTAHSSWMKNFASPPLFTKEITVVGEHAIEKVPANDVNNFEIRVDENDSRVVVSAREASMIRFNEAYLIGVNSNKIIFSKSFTQGVRSRVSIDMGNALPVGLNKFFVIDKLGRPAGTAALFIPGRKTIKVAIAPGEGLQTRKKTTLTISVTDENNRPVQGEFSLKVLNSVLADSTQVTFEQLMASSEPLNESWHQMLYERIGNPRYNFTTDLSKRGTAYMPDGVTPLPAETRVFFYIQETDVMSQTLTTAGGRVRLPVPDIQGTDNLFYMAELKGQELAGVKIVWDNEVTVLPSPPASKEGTEGDAYGIFTANKRMIDKAFDYDGTKVSEVTFDDERGVGDLEARLKGPDITIAVDDYVSFSTMEEMIREIVPALNVRRVRGKQTVQIGLQQGIPESEPLYIIDGIATKDTPFFLQLKPVDLVTVKLITNPAKLTTLGLMSRSGIVIVDTKSGKTRQPFDASRFVDGINQPIPFSQPKHNDIRRPDFRSTIYWNPIVKTDANGNAVVEFECSDDLSTVNVRVDGMTVDGRLFSGATALKFVLANN